MGEAIEFVEGHKRALHRMPTALFVRWDVIQQWTAYVDDHILRRRERETAA